MARTRGVGNGMPSHAARVAPPRAENARSLPPLSSTLWTFEVVQQAATEGLSRPRSVVVRPVGSGKLLHVAVVRALVVRAAHLGVQFPYQLDEVGGPVRPPP